MCSMHYLHPCAAIATICSMGYLPPCTARCDNAGICSIYRLHSCAATWPKHSHLQYEARATCNHALCAEMQTCAASTLCSHVQPHALDAATYSMQDTWHALYALNALARSMHFMQPCANIYSVAILAQVLLYRMVENGFPNRRWL